MIITKDSSLGSLYAFLFLHWQQLRIKTIKKNDEIINKLSQLEEKMDFNYNVINKHLVRLMAYGVKVKEGYIDGVRQPINCK